MRYSRLPRRVLAASQIFQADENGNWNLVWLKMLKINISNVDPVPLNKSSFLFVAQADATT
jgi:hypothetical protein